MKTRPPSQSIALAPAARLTRRAALGRLSAGALLALGLWPGRLSAKAQTGEAGAFKFISVNDAHYLSPDCGKFLEGVVRQMKTEGAEFCLLCGDLAQNGTREELAAVRDIFTGLGVPVHTVIGNHDYEKKKDRSGYESLLPDRINYWFEHRGWQFLGLDTTDGQDYELIDIQPPTFRWLDDNLAKLDPRKPTVLFTHFPLGEGVHYRPRNADQFLERLKPLNLQGIFSGHWHGFTRRPVGETFAVTGRCCALKRGNHDKSVAKGYLVCEARDGRVTYEFEECRIPKELEAVAGEPKKPKLAPKPANPQR